MQLKKLQWFLNSNKKNDLLLHNFIIANQNSFHGERLQVVFIVNFGRSKDENPSKQNCFLFFIQLQTPRKAVASREK